MFSDSPKGQTHYQGDGCKDEHGEPIMSKHTGQGQIIEAETITQDENGNWIPATPEPYYPNLAEKILHFFGAHQWTYTLYSLNGQAITDTPPDHAKCIMCGITYR